MSSQLQRLSIVSSAAFTDLPLVITCKSDGQKCSPVKFLACGSELHWLTFLSVWFARHSQISRLCQPVMRHEKGLKHTKTFFLQNVCFSSSSLTFMNNAFNTHLRFFSQKYARNKKERKFWPQGLLIAAFQQSYSQFGWKRPILEGSLIQNLPKPWIRLQVFFPE